MAEVLVIRIGNRPDDPVEWIAVDSNGARHSAPNSGTLADAAQQSGDRDVIVLVPGSDVLITSVDIPVKGGAKLAAALPFALEEFLADDVDELHFAPGTRRSNGRVPVCVVNRQLMSDWLSRIDEAGIRPTSVSAENCGLARIPGTVSLMVADGWVFINDGADVEFVLQGVSPGEALAAIGALDDGEPEDDDAESPQVSDSQHVLVYCDEESESRFQHDWIAIRHEMDSLDVKLLPDGVLPRLAATVATGAGINLLHGEFARKTEYSGYIKRWKYAAILLLALGLSGFAARGASYYQLLQQESSLNEQFQAEYQAIFPGAGEVLDPRAAVASARSRLGGGAAQADAVFLHSMQQLGVAIQQNREARIEAISYRAGVVDLRVKAPDVATLDRIQRAISQGGRFTAAIQSTSQDSDGVNSRIQIQASGA
jgi:general secretion pathway protein L